MDYRVRIPCATAGTRVSMCMMGGGRLKDTEETKANAHLIAAAPEMANNYIAVCQEPIEWKEDTDYEEGGYYCLTKSKYDAMCVALSKALGETL